MRILTVRQPFAWAIIHGGKDVENRTRNIAGDYRGPVVIHASATKLATFDHRHADLWPFTRSKHVLGAIIGVVDLVDVHMCSGGCSPWAEGPVDLGRGIRDLWHLEFANPRALDQPLPWKGALGLRKTNLFVSGDWLAEYHEPCKLPCTEHGCPPSCSSSPVARLEATA